MNNAAGDSLLRRIHNSTTSSRGIRWGGGAARNVLKNSCGNHVFVYSTSTLCRPLSTKARLTSSTVSSSHVAPFFSTWDVYFHLCVCCKWELSSTPPLARRGSPAGFSAPLDLLRTVLRQMEKVCRKSGSSQSAFTHTAPPEKVVKPDLENLMTWKRKMYKKR